MKKFFKSFLMAAAALMLFAGCNGLIDATVSGEPDKAVITIGIDGITESGVRSARNINPASLEGTAPSGFGKITLYGESEKGYKYKDSNDEVNILSEFNAQGKAEINLEYDVWYLTMRAYDASDKLLLEGRRRVDLKKGAPTSNEPLTFTLSTERVTTPGYINFSGSFTNPLIDEEHEDKGRLAVRYRAALYDLVSNEIVKCEDNTSSAVEGECKTTQTFTYYPSTSSAPDDGSTPVITPKAIKPGRYNFRIYFDMNKGSSTEPVYQTIGTWNDIVVIAPGRTTNGTDGSIGNIGDILNKAPDKPTALSAYYVGNPENKTNGDNFDVLIKWTPSASKNEDYYKLVIEDWTSGSAVDYKVFDADHEFYNSDIRVDGNLAGGTSECTVRLPVGKKYEISLTAVNVIGESAAESRKTSDVTTVADHVAYGTEKINLVKIAYDLNGGTLKNAADKSQVGGIVNKYYIFKNTEGFKIDVMSIKTEADEYPKLTKQNHPFLEWDEGDSKVEEITEFGNKYLTANYNVLSIINYTIDDSYGSIDTTAVQASENVKNAVLKNESPITITVENDSDDPAVTHIQVRLLGFTPETDIVIDKDSNSAITIDTKTVKSLDLRTYTVQVIATKADGKLYSNTFAITKQR